MARQSLSEEQFNELTDILTAAVELDTKLTGWESTFVTDLQVRVSKWGRKVMVSEKQWAVLRRIQGKL